MIRLDVAPANVEIAPAQPVSITISIVNPDERAWTGALRFVGIDPAWIDGLPEELSVGAGEQVEVPITVTLPSGFPSGAHLLGVETVAVAGERPAVAAFQLVIASVEGISVGLGPPSIRGGWRGRFRVNLLNRSAQPITLRLSGRGAAEDPKHALTFKFKPETITLFPGERARTKGWVTGRRPAIGAERTHPMTVVAQGHTAPIHAAGRFTQRPVLSRRVLRMVALVTMLAMWAGGLVTAVRFTEDQRTETAADASTESDAQDSDADGDGEDGAGDGDGASGPAAPPTGATISGQVSGLADRAGVRVDLRPVSLVDEISTEVELISSHDGAKSKLFAQSIDHEPLGPVAAAKSSTTDEEGFWGFGGLTSPANYELTFSKAGFGTRSYIVTVDEEHATVAIEVVLEAGDGRLSGTVSGPDGPLGGVTVTVTDGAVTYTTTTPTSGDGIGRWSVSGLGTPGGYLVTAAKRGYGTETVAVSLGGSASRDGVDLTMVPGVGSISGTVQGGGQALGGITVTAASETLVRSVTTLTDAPVGTFSLPQLPIPGSYVVTIEGTGWVSQTQRIDLTGNEDGVDFDLRTTTASISGRVSDADGPLAAVGVTVSVDGEPLVKTLTAASPQGSYEVSGLRPGTYLLSFERFGYTSASTIVEVVAGDRVVENVTLEVEPDAVAAGEAIVRGIVRSGATGDPISGAAVVLGSETATSDSEGSFRLEDLAAGTFALRLTHSRHQDTSRTIRLGVKDDVTIDVTMPVLGGIQGQVLDLTAQPLAGVTVSIVADTGTNAVSIPSVTTDAEGEYEILESLPTGSYITTYSKAGYDTRSRDFEAAAGTVTTVDVTLLELAEIVGTISEPATGVSGGFEPLDDVTVTLSLIGSGGALTTVATDTDADGEYRFSNLDPGDYRITATKTGYGTVTKDILGLLLREDADGSIVMDPGSQTIAGEVYYLDTSTPPVRVPVVGATVTTNAIIGFRTLTIFPFIAPNFATLTATTDAGGDWSVTGPTAGSSSNYTVTATGFTDRTVSIASPAAAGAADIELTPVPRDIVGSVNLLPVSGATNVSVTAAITSATVTTGLPSNQTLTVVTNGANTSYRFDDLRPATYTITFSATGYLTTTTSVTVPPGPSTTDVTATTVSLPKSSSITVNVVSSASGNPAVDAATVALTGAGTANGTTDASGNKTFTGLAAGAYTVTVSKTGFETTAVSRTIAIGEDAIDGNLDIVLPRFSSLTVNVSRNKDGTVTAGLTGATVTATISGGATTTLTDSDSDGVYETSALAPGSYTVTASKALHETATSIAFTVSAGADFVRSLTLGAYPDLTVTAESRLDALEPVLTGATVTATQTVGGSAVVSLLDGDSNGTYTSSALTPGTYTITLSSTAHDTTTVTGVVLTAGDDLAPTYELNKWPDLAVTARSKLSASVPGLAGATVTATPTAGTAALAAGARVLTDNTGGSYSVTSLVPGTYTITAVKTGDHDAATPVTGLVVAAGTTPATQTLDVLRWPDLAATVESSLDTVTATLAGATVTATPTAGGAGVRTLTDNTGGAYSVASLAPGTYTFSASKTGYDSHSFTAVAVVAGTALTDRAFTLLTWPTLTVNARSELSGAFATLAGATVTATPTAGGAGARTLTDAGGGTYTATSLAPGTYTITAVKTADHDAATPVTGLVVAAGTTPGAQTLDLQRWPTLTVNARSKLDADVPVLAGATVTATPTAGGAGARTLTDAGGGTYTAASLAPGTYTITAVKTADHDAATAVTGLVVVAGTTPATQTMDLLRWPTLTVNALSSVNAVTSALAGATVTATPTAGGAGARTLTDNTDGSYTAASVAPGTYTITAVKTADHDAATPETGVTVTAGASIAGSPYTLTLQKFAGLAVLVQRAADGGAAAAYESATVTAHKLTGGLGTARTATTVSLTHSAGGTYSTTAIAPGTYEVEATSTAHALDFAAVTISAGVDSTNADLVDPDDGGPRDASIIVLAWPTLRLTVTSSAAGSPAVEGATVTAYRMNPGRDAGTALVEGDPGVYTSAAGLNPGSYEIDVVKTGFATGTKSGITTVAGAANYADSLTLQLHSALTVTIRSNNGDGSPDLLSGATVTVTPSGGSATTLTDNSDGTYTGAALAPGDYTINASATGHTSATPLPITAVAGTDLTPSITLLKHPTLSVTVRSEIFDDDGDDVEELTDKFYSALTTATVVANRTGGGSVTLTHQGGGVYTGLIATDGVYTLNVTATGHIADTNNTVDIGPGDPDATDAIDLRAQTGTITGTVRKTNGSGLNNVTITAVSANGDVVTTGPTTGNGQFTLSTLAPVTWDITYTRDTYSPLTQAVTVTKNGTVTTTATLVEVGGTIQGSVFQKASNEVAVGTGNPSTDLNGATVKLFNDGSVTVLRTTTLTSTSNDYVFTNLASGTYDLTVEKTGFQGGGTLAIADVVVTAAGTVNAANAILYQNPGQVTARTVDAAAALITSSPQVEYTLINSNLLSASRVVTATAGEAVFTNVPPGTGYTITASEPSGLDEVDDAAGSVGTVNADGANTNYDEVFTEYGSITGTVQVDDDGGGADGNADGATVQVTGTSFVGAVVSSSTTTNASGVYTLSNVPRGSSYTLTFSLTGYATVTTTAVSVTRATATTADKIIEKLGSITVNVDDDAGVDLNGATVTLSAGPTAGSGPTAGAGTITFSSIAAGTYTITVTKTGYFTNTATNVVVDIGEAETQTIALDIEVVLTFQVYDGDSDFATEPISGALVTITLTDPVSTPSDTTGAPGTVVFGSGAPLRPQTISYEVDGPDPYDTVTVNGVAIGSGQPTTISVALSDP